MKWPLLVLPQLLLQLLLAPLIAAPAPGALLQLSGAPLRGGRLRGSFNLPFERASGADTPVLAFTAAGQPKQPLRLLLDTGTTLTLLLPAAARLGLRPQAQGAAALTLADGGLGCGELRPRRVKLPPLRLAGPNSRDGLLRLEGAEALVLPVAALPQGVLGIASLRQLPFASDPRVSRLRLGSAPRKRARAPLPQRSPCRCAGGGACHCWICRGRGARAATVIFTPNPIFKQLG